MTVHKHTWGEWNEIPGQYGSVERCCTTCFELERGRFTLTDVAENARERSMIRARTKYRRGYARTTRGQQRTLHKQNGPTAED